jgi:hypothetical protein
VQTRKNSGHTANVNSMVTDVGNQLGPVVNNFPGAYLTATPGQQDDEATTLSAGQ